MYPEHSLVWPKCSQMPPIGYTPQRWYWHTEVPSKCGLHPLVPVTLTSCVSYPQIQTPKIPFDLPPIKSY